METNATIRQAKQSDLESVVEIENLSFDSDRFSKQQFDYLAKRAKGKLYIADYKGRVIGYISLLSRKRSTCLRIYGIAIHPDVRGKKVAQQLIDAAKNYAINQKLKVIVLEVKVNNTAAIRLYEKNGFVTSSVKTAYYSDGTDAYRMRLDMKGDL